jgi:hypothetical protein
VHEQPETIPPPPGCPTSASDRLASYLARCIDDYGLSSFPNVCVPARIGRSQTLDSAVIALLSLHRLSSESGAPRKASPAFLKTYGRAISLVRQALSTSTTEKDDEIMAATRLIGLVDNLVPRQWPDFDTMKSCSSHWVAASKILLTRNLDGDPNDLSDLERASIYSGPTRTFAGPAFTGVTSPFDEPYWLNADPPISCASQQPIEMRRLRKIGHQLHTRLPHLMCLVRETLDPTMVHSSASHKAMSLAMDLLALEDKAAENWLLQSQCSKDRWPQAKITSERNDCRRFI